MLSIHGTYHDGRIELESPVDWPDGLRVGIVLLGQDSVGLPEADWPVTDESRSKHLAQFDRAEPPIFTSEDEIEISAARRLAREASLRAVRREMGFE
jgi:hypothetical protein